MFSVGYWFTIFLPLDRKKGDSNFQLQYEAWSYCSFFKPHPDFHFVSEIVCSCALVRGFLLLHYFTFESKVVQKLKCQAAQFHHPASLYSSEDMFNFWKKSICNEKVQKYLSVSSFLACTLNRLLIHLRRCCCLWQMTHFWPREILSNFPRSCKGFQLHLDTLHYVLWCIVSSQELWRILKVKLADLSIIF